MLRELLLLGAIALYAPVESKNLLEAIESRPTLSEAARMIKENELLAMMVKSQAYTAFIPTNNAMLKYDGPKDRSLIQYHLVNLPYMVKEIPDYLNTDLPGNPRVYVTRLPSGNPAIKGWEDQDYYINNAKIIDANIVAHGAEGQTQVLHIVDQVIVPTVARSGANVTISAGFTNPDAQKLLQKPQLYGLVDYYDISEFEKRVSALDIFDAFNMSGKNTFFIPVNQALNSVFHFICLCHVSYCKKMKYDILRKGSGNLMRKTSTLGFL